MAQSLKPASVLELAAGGGLLGAALYEPGRRVVVNDLRPVETRCWRDGEHLEVAEGNLFDLDPNELGQFDLVVACEVIEHVAHGDQFVAKLKQFVRPGGHVLITTPNGEFFRSKLPTYTQVEDFAALESQQFKPDSDGHLYLYTAAELEDVLRGAGFQDIRMQHCVSPFLSGDAAVRFLPAVEAMLPIYCTLDGIVSRSPALAKRLCTQLFALARG